MPYSVYDLELKEQFGFTNSKQIELYKSAVRISNYGAGLEMDWTSVVNAIRNMSNKDARNFVGKMLRQAGRRYIKKPVQQEIKRRYPGGKVDPRNKGRKSGVLRGVQYGPLWKDVKMTVYKNRNGVNVSLFSPKKGQNRWCVAMWLNDGTNERRSSRSEYKYNTTTKGKDFIRAVGKYNRGRITPSNYFEAVARQGLFTASNSVAQDISRGLVDRFNRK